MLEFSKKIEKPINANLSRLIKTTGKLVVKADNDIKWNGKVLKCEAFVGNNKQNSVSDVKPVMVQYCKLKII